MLGMHFISEIQQNIIPSFPPNLLLKPPQSNADNIPMMQMTPELTG